MSSQSYDPTGHTLYDPAFMPVEMLHLHRLAKNINTERMGSGKPPLTASDIKRILEHAKIISKK